MGVSDTCSNSLRVLKTTRLDRVGAKQLHGLCQAYRREGGLAGLVRQGVSRRASSRTVSKAPCSRSAGNRFQSTRTRSSRGHRKVTESRLGTRERIAVHLHSRGCRAQLVGFKSLRRGERLAWNAS